MTIADPGRRLVTMERGGQVHVPGGDVLGAYQHFQSMRGLLPSSITASDYMLGRFETWLGASLLCASTTDVNGWLDSRYRVPRTRYCAISMLHSFYRWAHAEGLVSEDPTLRVVRPRLRHYVPRPIADDDLRLALRNAEPMMRTWLCLGAFMGLRCQEIAGIRGEDILSDQDMLLVSMGKGHHQRLVPMNRQAEHALQALDPRKRGYIFRRADGHPFPPHRVSQRINTYMAGLGIRATAHQLRHWFGTKVYAETHDLRLTQELLGHASPTTTAIYVQFSPGEAAVAVRNLAV